MFKILSIYFLLSGIVLFSACNLSVKRGKIPLAKVGEQVLYLDDLKSVIPVGLSYDDSTMLAEDYIKKWIMNELMVKKAEENLSPSQKDLSRELNEYRNSMLTYRYKMELMLQKLDTTVSDREIAEYFEPNKENFILDKNLVKAIFIKIPLEVTKLGQVKAFCEQISDDSLRELQEFCLKYATTYDIFVDNWVELEVIARNLPKPIEDEQRFLRQNNILELRDNEFYYLFCVVDYRLANEIAPVEYVSESIKNAVINKRRIDFLKSLEDDVYLEGIRNNKFKMYSYENVSGI